MWPVAVVAVVAVLAAAALVAAAAAVCGRRQTGNPRRSWVAGRSLVGGTLEGRRYLLS